MRYRFFNSESLESPAEEKSRMSHKVDEGKWHYKKMRALLLAMGFSFKKLSGRASIFIDKRLTCMRITFLTSVSIPY